MEDKFEGTPSQEIGAECAVSLDSGDATDVVSNSESATSGAITAEADNPESADNSTVTAEAIAYSESATTDMAAAEAMGNPDTTTDGVMPKAALDNDESATGGKTENEAVSYGQSGTTVDPASADQGDEKSSGSSNNDKKSSNESGEIYDYSMKSTKERIENFWYHYKWHTIVLAVVAVVLAILIHQAFNVPKYDVNVVYAGGHGISKLRSNGEQSPYEVMLKSLGRVVTDFDKNGEIKVNLINKYILTSKEITSLEAQGKGDSINYSTIKNDYDDLSSIIMTGDACVILMSEALFEEYYGLYDGGALFVDLTPYLASSDASEMEVLGGGKAVRLSDLPFSELPEIEKLPDDTVLCLRTLSEGAFIGIGGNEEQFNRAKETVKRILTFK